MADILNVSDGTPTVRSGALGGASMRYHELAIQSWLNGLFFVREGYPVPVVFTSPMDAFSAFKELWADTNNPFAYLLDLKDANGIPLYEPYPSPVRYPIISVHRKSWKYRTYQNFSIHRWRHINWPTVSNAGTAYYGPEALGWDLTKCRLGNVTTSRMPMAWDYRFQIDHFCNRPDTQAFFLEQLMHELWRTGGVPQTWLVVPYPGWGKRRVRLYLDGDIESLTPEEPEEGKNVEYRTSFTVVLEGFDVDLHYEVYPALWNLIMRLGPVAPIELSQCFYGTYTTDLRISGSNSSIDLRPNVPSWGTCQDALRADINDQIVIQMVSLDNTGSNAFGIFTVGTIPTGSYASVAGQTTSFVNGTLSEAVTEIFAYGTDYAGLSNRLVYGSCEIYVNTQPGLFNIALLGGTLADVSVTVYGTGTAGVNTAFLNGTLQDLVLTVYGTDYGTAATAFLSGTLFDTTVSAGTFYESGTVATSFVDGTITVMILEIGTKFEYFGQTIGLLNGTLA